MEVWREGRLFNTIVESERISDKWRSVKALIFKNKIDVKALVTTEE